MKQKDNWGWHIEIENIHDKTKTNILINNNKGCVYIEKEIIDIIRIFKHIENKITIYFQGVKEENETKNIK